jgi:mannose-6-phosphate isomerase-like protein (cupin superfamily)
MNYFAKKNIVVEIKGEGFSSFPLLNDVHGCVKGCCTGIIIYTAVEYPSANVHEDQEGFIVMEGAGWAKVGAEEFRLETDTAFIVPAGINHTIKRDPNSKSIKLFWFHAAI